MSVRYKLKEPLQIQGKGLAIARLVWVVITVLTVTLLATGINFLVEQIARTVDERALMDLDLAFDSYASFVIVLNLFVVVVHVLIAAIIFWRRSNDWVAWLVSLTLVANSAAHMLSPLHGANWVPPLWDFLANVVIYVGLLTSFTLLYVFPDGRFIPWWTRILALGWAIILFFAVFVPGSVFSLTGWPAWLRLLVLLAGSGIGVAAQIYRYQRVSRPVQRQQTKWALLGLTAAALGPIVILVSLSATGGNNEAPNILYQRVGAGFFTFSFLFRLVGLSLFRLGTLLFPLSFAIAVLRYRLWDIDIIIRRTITYSSLTVLLVVLYLFIVVLLELALSGLVEEPSPLAVVVSTLAIAALFNSLRRRVQEWIDRQFYRGKYDAEKSLVAFSASLREEVNLSQLSQRLLAVVEETMHPEHASLWLVAAQDESKYLSEKD